MTQTIDIGLNRDDPNPIIQNKAQPYTSAIAALFEGPLESTKQVDRPALNSEHKIGS